jgi:hypothetical protein
VVVKASLRSYIVHHDQSGLSRPFLRGTGIITTQYIHKCVKVNKAINVFKALRKAINIFKAIMEFKAWDFDIFPTHPGPHVNLLRVGKTLCAKATVREENHVRFSAHFPYFCPSSRAYLT